MRMALLLPGLTLVTACGFKRDEPVKADHRAHVQGLDATKAEGTEPETVGPATKASAFVDLDATFSTDIRSQDDSSASDVASEARSESSLQDDSTGGSSGQSTESSSDAGTASAATDTEGSTSNATDDSTSSDVASTPGPDQGTSSDTTMDPGAGPTDSNGEISDDPYAENSPDVWAPYDPDIPDGAMCRKTKAKEKTYIYPDGNVYLQGSAACQARGSSRQPMKKDWSWDIYPQQLAPELIKELLSLFDETSEAAADLARASAEEQEAALLKQDPSCRKIEVIKAPAYDISVSVFSTLSSVSPSLPYDDTDPNLIQKTRSAIKWWEFKHKVISFIAGGTANPMVAFSTSAWVKASKERVRYKCTPRS
jgi:hypothetical protein